MSRLPFFRPEGLVKYSAPFKEALERLHEMEPGRMDRTPQDGEEQIERMARNDDHETDGSPYERACGVKGHSGELVHDRGDGAGGDP